MFPGIQRISSKKRRKSADVRKKSADALEKGQLSPGGPPPGGLTSLMGAGGIIKLAAGVADMQPKIINRQMSTQSFDMNSRQYEQVRLSARLQHTLGADQSHFLGVQLSKYTLKISSIRY